MKLVAIRRGDVKEPDAGAPRPGAPWAACEPDRREHEDEKLGDEIEGHALRDDEVRQVVDPSMTRKKVKSMQPNANGETSSRAMYRSRTRNRTSPLCHRRVNRPSGWTGAETLVTLPS